MYGKKEYESYPFLYEKKKIVDFELLTDEITSQLGYAVSICEHPVLQKELTIVAQLVYHLNPCVRKKTEIQPHEIAWLQSRYKFYQEETSNRESLFVLPTGTPLASTLHVCRCKAKQLVRLLFLITEEGITVQESLFDFSNILANYLFTAAMYANKLSSQPEVPFTSRVY
jgi:ATP:cob(I)alamin adenosyltransferase